MRTANLRVWKISRSTVVCMTACFKFLSVVQMVDDLNVRMIVVMKPVHHDFHKKVF